MRKLREEGFTLIELIMVMVILGIIAAIAIPKYMDLTTDAKTNALKGALGSIRAAVSVQYANNVIKGNNVYPTLNATIFAENRIPDEPFTPTDAVKLSASGTGSIADFNDVGGWIYNKTTGEVRVNKATYHTL